MLEDTEQEVFLVSHILRLIRNALEELSVRAGVALNQKRVLHDLTIPGKDQVFENEYLSLSAQVVRITMSYSIIERSISCLTS